MSKIIELVSENFKRLKAVRIVPNGNTVVLNGKNAQGKSSVLDAITAALGGSRGAPEEPIRRGASKSRTVLKLDDPEITIIEQRFGKRGMQLKLLGPNGEPLARPQEKLNELYDKKTVDPLAFERMKPGDQLLTLRNLVGADTTELDIRRAELEAQRKAVNQEIKRLKGLLDSMPDDPTAPDSEQDSDTVVQKWRTAEQERSAFADREGKLAARIQAADEMEAKIKTWQDNLVQQRRWIEHESSAIEQARGSVPDVDSLKRDFDELSSLNARARNRKLYLATERELDATQEQSESLTERMRQVDTDKATMLSGATFPVDGLGFGESGIMFHGIPFSQASQAERLRISTSIALSLKPKLRVLLLRDASNLDEDGMKLIADMAEEHGAQLWLERAGHHDEGAILIQDGEVVDDHDTAEA
jgi:DNA repair ATPase RecN